MRQRCWAGAVKWRKQEEPSLQPHIVLSWPFYTSGSSTLCCPPTDTVKCCWCVWVEGNHPDTVSLILRILQNMLSFLCQSLFGSTQCKPAETQLPGEKEIGATGNCRELQAALQGKTAHSSDGNEISGSNVTPKKTSVIIMVAPPHQQVG